jgi:homoserine kinase type II
VGSFTRLDDADVAALARGFGAGELRSWRPIAAGTINSNFAIETSSGRFFLRINEGKSEEAVRYEAALVAELERAGVPVVAPLPSLSGEPFARHSDRYASLFPWIDGGHRARGEVSEGDAEAVGAALARLHEAGLPIAERFERAGIYTFDDIVGRFEGLRGSADPALVPALLAIGEEIPWLRERARVRDAATRGLIHGDLFRDNVVFRGNELAALIDFEQASSGSLVYDLAVCVNAWCFDEDVKPALARAMVGGYASLRALSAAEREALYVELRAAAMRFTVTRITDVYLPGNDHPEKDFRRYARRLERWRELGPDAVAGWF